ncbi:MAG: thioredoxin domain-containing protein, partial [Acidobacteria bacterium]|nr:thioredoxin domain-containing protein [Acidobacteriota bacterium]
KIATTGVAMPQMLSALMFSLAEPREIVIAGERGGAGTEALFEAVWSRFLPDAVVMLAGEVGRNSPLLPGARDKQPVNGAAAAYVCHNYACQLPVTEVGDLLELLR